MCFTKKSNKASCFHTLSKSDKAISIFLCLAFTLFALYKTILTCVGNEANYLGFNIPDLMINYQGGFIRRGLLGEIMYQVFLIHPYPFHTVLIYTETIIFTAFLALSFYVFHKLKSIPIMPLAILTGGLTSYRRDFLMIILAFIVIHLMIQYVKHNNKMYLILAEASIIIAVLIYEPSFFFIEPISMFIYYINYDKKRKNRLKKAISTLFVFCLPIATMLIVCSAKGTTTQAEDIWQSWSPLFDYLNVEQPNMPSAIQFLSKSESVSNVAMFHLGINFGIGIGCKLGFNIFQVLGYPLFFAGIYFLTITIPQKVISVENTKLLSSLFLFQFICLLPMFTILSCDFGRTILYVTFTSYYLVYLIKNNNVEIHMKYIDSISDKVSKILNGISSQKKILWHLIILTIVPFQFCMGVSISHPLISEYWPIVLPKIQSLLSYIGL